MYNNKDKKNKETDMDKENVYRKARKKAAERDDRFSSAEKVAMLNFMDKAKVLDVENGAAPDPEFVKWMAESYEAPELINYYCTHQCPLGDKKEAIKNGSLEELSWHLLSGIYFLGDIKAKMFDLTRDGKISDAEKSEFIRIIDNLKSLAATAESLEVWAKKEGII